MGRMLAEQVIETIKLKRSWSDADVESFMSPTREDLHDPFLLEHVEAFIDQLHHYKTKKVTIVPDYDADGILSGSLLAGALSAVGFTDVSVYPPRIQTGYGITEKSAKEALNRFGQPDVVITTDNGSNAFAGINYLVAQGVPVLISDHHKATDGDPSEVAVNPNRPSDTYPFKGLSGTAVIWKIMQAYASRYGTEREQRLIDQLIVLVGISTISDVMPLLDENRYIVQTAVERLQDVTFLSFGAECDGQYGAVFRGLLALHNVCKANKKFDYGFDEMTLGFVFGPMLNSPRRMSGSSKAGFALLLNDSYEDAVTQAKTLFGTNEDRKRLMRGYADQYLSPVLPSPDKLDYMIGAVPFRHGLIGLLAGQFTSKFDLPSIVFGGQGLPGVCFAEGIDPVQTPILGGSARSPEWFDLHGCLTDISHEHPTMFKSFGGHKQAAGLSIYAEQYHTFREAFKKRVVAVLQGLEDEWAQAGGSATDDTIWLSWTDGDVLVKTPTALLELVPVLTFIDQLKPFGQGFQAPVFGVKFNTDEVDVSFMGADGQHVKFVCPNGLSVIQWNGADALRKQLGHLDGPFEFAIRGSLKLNSFRNQDSLQLIADQLIIL